MSEPTVYGKYLLLDRIAVGGMAEVFKAKSFGVHGFERLLVIKRILPHLSQDEEFVQMFIDEAKIAVELTHANICQVFDLGRINKNYFIAMEFINGKDLRAILKKCFEANQALPIPLVLFVICETLKGLDYAHGRTTADGSALALIHRDISPQNVMISYHGEIKIVDFGIAKTDSKSHKTQAGVLKGKFGYMSPEQAAGQSLDARTDLFSTAIILFECLTNRRLFSAETDFETLELIRNCEVPTPSSYNPEIFADLDAFLLKALAKEPDERFATAHDMHVELSRILYGSYGGYSSRHLAQFMSELFRSEIAQEQEALKRSMDAVPSSQIEQLSQAAEPSFRPPPSTHSPTLPKTQAPSDRTESVIVANFDKQKNGFPQLLWGIVKLVIFLAVPAYLTYVAFHKFSSKDETVEKKSPSKNQTSQELPPVEIQFDSVPTGATLKIDGIEKSTTPVKISLVPNKTYNIDLQKEGYDRLQETLYVSPGQNIPPYRMKQSKMAVVSLLIQSEPEGASIFINDKDVGQTTPSAIEISEESLLRLEKEGYEPAQVNIGPRSKTQKIKLVKAKAELSISIQPENATIYLQNKKVSSRTIDGLELGKTYALRFEASGYLSKELNLTLDQTKQVVEITLEKKPVPMGRVNINAKPWALVILDGKPLQNTPILDFEIPVGSHEIVFKHDQYPPKSMKIQIKKGDNPPIIIDMRQ